MKVNMKNTIITSSLCLAAFVTLGCGQGQAPATASSSATPPAVASSTPAPAAAIDLEVAKKTYLSSCAACHGKDGKGLPNLGKDLVDSEFVAKISDEDLLTFVKKGRPTSDPANTTGIDMPPKGGNPALQDAQIREIIAYIRSIHA